MLLEIIDEKTQIIPGHGPLASKSDLQKYYEIVSETISFIEVQKAQGKSLEDIQMIGLPKQYTGITGYIPASIWIETVYSDLSK